MSNVYFFLIMNIYIIHHYTTQCVAQCCTCVFTIIYIYLNGTCLHSLRRERAIHCFGVAHLGEVTAAPESRETLTISRHVATWPIWASIYIPKKVLHHHHHHIHRIHHIHPREFPFLRSVSVYVQVPMLCCFCCFCGSNAGDITTSVHRNISK